MLEQRYQSNNIWETHFGTVQSWSFDISWLSLRSERQLFSNWYQITKQHKIFINSTSLVSVKSTIQILKILTDRLPLINHRNSQNVHEKSCNPHQQPPTPVQFDTTFRRHYSFSKLNYLVIMYNSCILQISIISSNRKIFRDCFISGFEGLRSSRWWNELDPIGIEEEAKEDEWEKREFVKRPRGLCATRRQSPSIYWSRG